MGSGKKRKPDLLPLGKGLTAAFEATLNQTYPIQAKEEQSEGGGGGYKEADEKDKENYEGEDDYNYQDISTIHDLWLKLQCDDVFSSGPIPLHNHTRWIDLCLD